MVKKPAENQKMGAGSTLAAYKKGRKYATILRIKINSSSASQALKQISNEIAAGNRFLVVTPNPEIVMEAQADTVLCSILNSAAFSLPDGVGLMWANRINAWKSRVLPRVFLQENPQGDPFLEVLLPGSPALIKERVSGVDMMQSLVEVASERGWRVFLLGGSKDVATAAARKLKIENYKLKIEFDSGPWLDKDGRPVNSSEARKEERVIKKINDFKPELLFVGFGAPKQEKWASRNLRLLDVNCAMVVGGAFDYISGKVPRAPRFVRSMGLEWLFRLIVQPSRVKRQAALLRFVWAVIKGR